MHEHLKGVASYFSTEELNLSRDSSSSAARPIRFFISFSLYSVVQFWFILDPLWSSFGGSCPFLDQFWLNFVVGGVVAEDVDVVVWEAGFS